MIKNNIDQVIQRTKQYWYVDGLHEFAFGGLCLVLALYFALQASLPPSSLISQLLNAGFVLIIVGSGLLVNKFTHSFKQRLTYPRTGYVAYPRSQGKSRWFRMIFAAAFGIGTSLIVGLLFLGAPSSLILMPAITGFVFCVVLLLISYRISLARFALLGMISLLTGTGLAFTGLGDIPGLAIFYGLIGLALVISGGLTLRRYLRQNQPEKRESS